MRVRKILKGYNLIAVRIKNLEIEKGIQEEKLRLSVRPPALDDVGGGGTRAGKSSVEAAADYRENVRWKIDRIDLEIKAACADRDKVDNALGVLTEEEREIIKAVYFKGLSRVKVAMEHSFTERTVRAKESTALDKMALMI